MISIVIPAHNEESYIPKCIESLKNQDYQGKYEIIVVDNASTDRTSVVARGLGARVVSCPKKGVVYARQAGAQAASGEIIIQADADTIYPVGWLSRIERHFTSHLRTMALAGEYRYDTAMRWSKIEYSLRFVLNVLGLILINRPLSISGANFAFRREAFLKTNGYDPEASYPDQWGISRDISRVGKIDWDRKLLVYTSTRRIQKPYFFVAVDVFRNSFKMLVRYFKYVFNAVKKGCARLSAKKKSPDEVTLDL